MKQVLTWKLWNNSFRTLLFWDRKGNFPLVGYDLTLMSSIDMMNLTKMQINTGNSEPVSQKPYPIAMKHYDQVKDEISKLLDAKILHSFHSSWSAPTIIVPKGDGGNQLVINYRALNKVPWKFIWPMPKVIDIVPNWMVQNIFQPWSFMLDIITYPWTMPQSLKESSHHSLENTSPWKFLLD